MNRTEQSRNTYNSRAKNYTETPEGRFTARFKQELVRAVQLKPGGRGADVACGATATCWRCWRRKNEHHRVWRGPCRKHDS